MRKQVRQKLIKEILQENVIYKQEDIVEKLNARGINVTQATISRDVKEMQLVKLPTQTGSYRYSMPTLKEINVEKKLSDTLSESYVSSAQNRELCVFKVLPGSGPAVANLIEQAKYPEVFATLGDDALTTADRCQTFKMVARHIARKYGLFATFMAKPVEGQAGNGMHNNMSLFKDNHNVFYDKDGEFHLSNTALYFLNGILEHARAITAIGNPTVNSYKRLIPGFEAPVYIAWAAKNRSPLVRIPSAELKIRMPR